MDPLESALMIKTFVSTGLRELWNKKSTAKIDKKMHGRILRCLDALDAAVDAGEMNIPGFNFHPLKGKPLRYSIHVNGPWCITFEFEGGDALRVDYEQYH
jgi:proteic killer suppression protein